MSQARAAGPEELAQALEHPARALWWDADTATVRLVDQSVLPGRYVVLRHDSPNEIAEAIRSMRVRGAPAIGVAAAYALALAARLLVRAETPVAELLAWLCDEGERLIATRPTAVNLAWAVRRVLAEADRLVCDGATGEAVASGVLAEAQAIAAEDAAACQAMGEYGAELVADGDTVLTHCNAGALATAGIGTALAPIYVAHGLGKRVAVVADETRPVLQGARLTAWELQRAGIPVTLITDNMAAHFMWSGRIQSVFVGADRIAANGDVANKIGTYGVAVLAHAHGIPVYVVAPRSTLDLSLPDGAAIPIEERAPDEVTSIGGTRIAPEGVAVANPAFDVTPARYVSAIITDAGVARAPFGESLARLVAAGAAAAHASFPRTRGE